VPASQARTGVPAAVERVVARAMQKNPQQRYQDAAEMAKDLMQCRTDMLRAGGSRPDGLEVDLFIASGTHPVPAQWSLVPAPGFDAAPVLKGFLARAAKPPSTGRVRRIAWMLGYAAAAAAAIAIAFG
jgi:hypothetical protein